MTSTETIFADVIDIWTDMTGTNRGDVSYCISVTAAAMTKSTVSIAIIYAEKRTRQPIISNYGANHSTETFLKIHHTLYIYFIILI
jgi:ABC-type polysaccharide transport system permease subunit